MFCTQLPEPEGFQHTTTLLPHATVVCADRTRNLYKNWESTETENLALEPDCFLETEPQWFKESGEKKWFPHIACSCQRNPDMQEKGLRSGQAHSLYSRSPSSFQVRMVLTFCVNVVSCWGLIIRLSLPFTSKLGKLNQICTVLAFQLLVWRLTMYLMLWHGSNLG